MTRAIDITELAIAVVILGIVVNTDDKKVLKNFTRLKILEGIYKEDQPISLMKLSRKVGSSKSNVERHLKILKEHNFIVIKKAEKALHNPLLIELEPTFQSKIAEKLNSLPMQGIST